VGPGAVLDAVVRRKIPSPFRESNPRAPIVQAVAQGNVMHEIFFRREVRCMSEKWLTVTEFSMYSE
jgi:hypothetical protein